MSIQDHELKSWPSFFEDMVTGIKAFDYRINDRNFKALETLLLREWDPESKEYTGRMARFLVTEIWHNIPGMPEGYCIMQVKLMQYF